MAPREADQKGAGDGVGKGGGDLERVHARFARAVMVIYALTAAIAGVMLVALLVADRDHGEQQAQRELLLSTEARSHYLGRDLAVLGSELRRLSLRSEIDLLDHDLDPERSLLNMSHEKSAFFNVGVAIAGRDGNVEWSEPASFLPTGTSLAIRPWFAAIKKEHDLVIVPVDVDAESSSQLYLVAPIMRGDTFGGALIGAIDLAAGGAIEPAPGAHVDTVLATRTGTVVYPPHPPDFTDDPNWRRTLPRGSWEPFTVDVTLEGARRVVAGDPVPGTDLLLMAVVTRDALFAPSRARFTTRLTFGIAIALVPVVLFLLLLRRTLSEFHTSQAEAARGERLRLVGEAANLIAHEVKNSLNGLQLGLDLVLRGEKQERPSVRALRSELTRLSGFTTKLLTFSKGITPRPAAMDLADFVGRIVELSKPGADELGVALDVEGTDVPVRVRADSSLVHVVVSNLVQNALDALAGASGARRIVVAVSRLGDLAIVRVADDGPGVAPSVRAHLFEPFVTGKPSGVGIGLALSRKIARAHGGDLVLEPSTSGASFALTLPALPEKAPAEEGSGS